MRSSWDSFFNYKENLLREKDHEIFQSDRLLLWIQSKIEKKKQLKTKLRVPSIRLDLSGGGSQFLVH